MNFHQGRKKIAVERVMNISKKVKNKNLGVNSLIKQNDVC